MASVPNQPPAAHLCVDGHTDDVEDRHEVQHESPVQSSIDRTAGHGHPARPHPALRRHDQRRDTGRSFDSCCWMRWRERTDIDIRNRIRTAVGLIFHHAVFVSAIIRCRRSSLSSSSSYCTTPSLPPPSSSTETRTTNDSDAHRALAVAMVRLLTKLDTSFDSYHREVTYTLADEIKAFLEYTGHKLLAKQTPQTQQLLLHSMSACFDLMGAALVFKVLGDNHVDYAVQRTCELFGSSCGNFKSVLLTDLLNHWLIMKREVGTSELCRYVRIEIEKTG
ncbi:unnamed protein product [Mucor fragilis]